MHDGRESRARRKRYHGLMLAAVCECERKERISPGRGNRYQNREEGQVTEIKRGSSFFAIEIKRGSREPGNAVPPVAVPRVVCPGLKIKRGQTKAEALNFLCQTLTTRLHISSKLFFFVETSHISYAGLT